MRRSLGLSRRFLGLARVAARRRLVGNSNLSSAASARAIPRRFKRHRAATLQTCPPRRKADALDESSAPVAGSASAVPPTASTVDAQHIAPFVEMRPTMTILGGGHSKENLQILGMSGSGRGAPSVRRQAGYVFAMQEYPSRSRRTTPEIRLNRVSCRRLRPDHRHDLTGIGGRWRGLSTASLRRIQCRGFGLKNFLHAVLLRVASKAPVPGPNEGRSWSDHDETKEGMLIVRRKVKNRGSRTRSDRARPLAQIEPILPGTTIVTSWTEIRKSKGPAGTWALKQCQQSTCSGGVSRRITKTSSCRPRHRHRSWKPPLRCRGWPDRAGRTASDEN